jgi:hypothetical protein
MFGGICCYEKKKIQSERNSVKKVVVLQAEKN